MTYLFSLPNASSSLTPKCNKVDFLLPLPQPDRSLVSHSTRHTLLAKVFEHLGTCFLWHDLFFLMQSMPTIPPQFALLSSGEGSSRWQFQYVPCHLCNGQRRRSFCPLSNTFECSHRLLEAGSKELDCDHQCQRS